MVLKTEVMGLEFIFRNNVRKLDVSLVMDKNKKKKKTPVRALVVGR